jgi:hypothetical protein
VSSRPPASLSGPRNVVAVLALAVVATLAVAGGCTHDRAAIEARLAEARARTASARDADTVIGWSDAVAAALRAGVAAPDDGDLDDALNRLRVLEAGAFGEERLPVASARARLLEAAGRQADADAAWIEAARARPAPDNLDALFAAAERADDRARLRALCAVGPVALPVDALSRWLDRCSDAANLGRDEASAMWLATDRTRLVEGREPAVDTPLAQCLQRCRPALYRAVAACPLADDRCLGVAAHAFDVCETNCRALP